MEQRRAGRVPDARGGARQGRALGRRPNPGRLTGRPSLNRKDLAAMQPDAEFNAYLAEGRFMIQRSRSSGKYVFYPRVAEPGTGARDLEWTEASGLGTVY